MTQGAGYPARPPDAHGRETPKSSEPERSSDRPGVDECPICLGGRPAWPGTGRPRVYCGETCKRRARQLRALQRHADRWRERGYRAREAHVRGVIERRLETWRGG